MSDSRDEVDRLLAERPELGDPLAELLAQDEDRPWSFDEAPFDSGEFGEIVSRDIVVEVDGGYRLADRSAVRRALDTEDSGDDESQHAGVGNWLSQLATPPQFDRTSVIAVAGALVFLFGVRVVLLYDQVFRGDMVTLTGNDPYRFRYVVEQLLTHSADSLNLSSRTVRTGDTLYIVTLWAVVTALGGGPDSVGATIAWVPPILGLLTGLVVALVATRLTGDKRVGLTAVLFLAVTPSHGFRTALGFADHHAFDYLWLSVTVLGVVLSARWEKLGRTGRIAALGLTAVGPAAQVLSWRGGPLMLVPLAATVFCGALLAITAGERPVRRLWPLLTATGVGAAATTALHVGAGWLPRFRVAALLAVFGGGVTVTLIAELCRRFDLSTTATGVVTGTGVTGLTAGVLVVTGEFTATVTRGVAYFQRTGQSGIAETYSLIGSEMGTIVGPIFLFGLVLFLSLPYVGWSLLIGVRRNDLGWLAAGLYSLYFFVMSVVQVRFAGQLSLFTSVFGAIGFLHLLTWIDVLPSPDWLDATHRRTDSIPITVPDADTLKTLALVFLLVSSLGIVQTAIKQQQVATDEQTVATISAVADHAQESERDGADPYVFSPWPVNYEFNYFVSGWAGSYTFAQDHYTSFVTASNQSAIDTEYHRLRRQGAEYVAVSKLERSLPPGTTHSRLVDRYGSAGAGHPGLGHYRAVYRSDGGKWTVFEVVEGLRIVGEAPANTQVDVTTTVTIRGQEVTYRRTVSTNRYGEYSVTVPYPGTYTVDPTNVTFDVTESQVETGAYTSSYRLHLPFDDVGDGAITDDISGARDTSSAVSPVDGPVGTAVELDGSDSLVFDTPLTDGTESFSLAFWVRGNLSESPTIYPRVFFTEGTGQFGVWARTGGSNDFGVAVDSANETRVRNFGIDLDTMQNWTHVAVVLDGPDDELRLYRNSHLVSTVDASAVGQISVDRYILGGKLRGEFARTALDDVRGYTRPLDNQTVEQLYELGRTQNQTVVNPEE